ERERADAAQERVDLALLGRRRGIGNVENRDFAAIVIAHGDQAACAVDHATALERRCCENVDRTLGNREVDDRESIVVIAAGNDDVGHCAPPSEYKEAAECGDRPAPSGRFGMSRTGAQAATLGLTVLTV